MTDTRRFALAPVRPDWLSSSEEVPLDPSLPIIDAHHHLLDRPALHYLLDDFLADIELGHKVVASIYVQARAAYLPDGPEPFRPVGETAFARRIGDLALAQDAPRVCAGIVAYADLTLGDAVVPILEAHVAEAGGRLRGIRHILAWDPDQRLMNPAYPTTETMMDNANFRAGLARLVDLDLSFDAWLHFHQIPRLTALARALPELPIVLNHCGGILGLGDYASRRDEVFDAWRAALRDLAACPNVSVKIGGLGMAHVGFGFEALERAPSSQVLAAAWRPWIETSVETFGSSRAMFESNAPIDKGGYSYGNGWNAFKRLCQGASESEKADLFHRTAMRLYRLDVNINSAPE